MPALEHGHSKPPSRTYKSWCNAKARCFNQSRQDYARYGGRGITMCPAWRESFAAFLADMGECPPGLTLDRIDNNGNYEPGNCAWRGWETQQRNRGNFNRQVTLDGVRMTIAEATERLGLPRTVIYGRLRYGWSEAEAVNPDFVRPVRLVEYDGQRIPIAEAARRTGIPERTLRSRLRYGWGEAEVTNPTRYARRKHV